MTSSSEMLPCHCDVVLSESFALPALRFWGLDGCLGTGFSRSRGASRERMMSCIIFHSSTSDSAVARVFLTCSKSCSTACSSKTRSAELRSCFNLSCILWRASGIGAACEASCFLLRCVVALARTSSNLSCLSLCLPLSFTALFGDKLKSPSKAFLSDGVIVDVTIWSRMDIVSCAACSNGMSSSRMGLRYWVVEVGVKVSDPSSALSCRENLGFSILRTRFVRSYPPASLSLSRNVGLEPSLSLRGLGFRCRSLVEEGVLSNSLSASVCSQRMVRVLYRNGSKGSVYAIRLMLETAFLRSSAVVGMTR
jgi:hypothetical protein